MKKLLFVLLLSLIIPLTACSDDDKNVKIETKSEPKKEQPTMAKAETTPTVPYFQDDIMKTDEFTIKLLGHEVVDTETAKTTGNEPSKMLMITYEYTNISDKRQSPIAYFQYNFKAIQDSYKLMYGYPMTEPYRTLIRESMNPIEPNVTVTVKEFYILNDSSPVTLTGMIGNKEGTGEELGQKTYNIE